MGNGNVGRGGGDTPIGDVAYLARSDHRVPALVALTERPRSRSELCELTGVSSSTMRRTLDEFVGRRWIRKDGYQYVATRLGEAVAAAMDALLERMETERRMRTVWHWLPEPLTELRAETWSDLTVTVAEPDGPYRPVDRFEALLGDSERVRFLRPEVALMEPCFDSLGRLVDDGADVTLIDRPNCHRYFASTYPDRCRRMVARENFTVLEHDDLPPYGVGLLDDRVVVSCYERASGTVQAVVDTDLPVVREWARSVYDGYVDDARPFELRRAVE